MKTEIKVSSEADIEYIHGKLREYNSRYMHDFEEFNFHIEENGRIVGGIVAESISDTVEVEFLFVDEACRGKGLGGKLLAYVEEEAKRKGLKRILLNTYSFQAPEFYKKAGYTELLKIDPVFDGCTQSYFIKNL